MKMLKWSYSKRNHIRASFDSYPNTLIIFRRIKGFYFAYTMDWSAVDPAVSKADLERMELLLNRELGSEDEYLARKSSNISEENE
ncbi:hypothetical protein JOC77_000422 [Peribacillus deserti]|uniref:Uncharacterized protein n=1 Tax=Peribacillus deserti TaxID=673318 RepID=A0ABS2QDY5_9BACI|nr:hypothetical protein [Peribacillus deserti]MBM7691019.1 hypothetical protein [Peribacillus deserti]